MKTLYFFVLVQVTCNNVHGYKPDYAVKKQSKSIYSNKEHTQTIIPARYKAGNHIKYDNSATDNFMPEHYFPDVEYPINILEASKPFYVITGENNALLTPFTDDVTTNFNSAHIKPTSRKIKPEMLNKKQLKALGSKSMAYKTINTENKKSVAENLAKTAEIDNLKENVLNKTLLVSTIKEQASLQQPKTDEKNDNTEKTMPTEAESDEYLEYEDTYYDYTDNVNEDNPIDDLVEVFNSNEFFNGASFENNTPEDASVSQETVADNNPNTPQNSTLKDNNAPVNVTTLEEPDTCPLKECPIPVKKNNATLNIERKPKKIGLGPVQTIKQRKFLKHMNTVPFKQ